MDFDLLSGVANVFAATEAPALDMGIRLRLSVMNFLEFAIWGAWFVVLGQYLNALKFTGKQIGSIYATMSLGSIVTPRSLTPPRLKTAASTLWSGRV